MSIGRGRGRNLGKKLFFPGMLRHVILVAVDLVVLVVLAFRIGEFVFAVRNLIVAVLVDGIALSCLVRFLSGSSPLALGFAAADVLRAASTRLVAAGTGVETISICISSSSTSFSSSSSSTTRSYLLPSPPPQYPLLPRRLKMKSESCSTNPP